MEKQFFTLEEARNALPTIREWLGKAMQLSNHLHSFSDSVQVLADNASENAGSPEGTAYLQILLALQEYLAKIQDSGCLVKSVDEGLIDFPHIRDGREVYLCWRYGEEDIEYWHEVDAGFAGRTPI